MTSSRTAQRHPPAAETVQFSVVSRPLYEPADLHSFDEIDGPETLSTPGSLSTLGAAGLLPQTDSQHPLLWLRRGEGMVGRGEALRLEFRGPQRIAQAAAVWRSIAAAAQIQDAVGLAGSGLIAFGAFTFSEHSELTSVLIVPRTVIGLRNGRAWITEIRRLDDGVAAPRAGTLPVVENSESETKPSLSEPGLTEPGTLPATTPLGDAYRATLHPGRLSKADYQTAVAEVTTRIARGHLNKAVLARDLVGSIPPGIDLRPALSTLTLGYPDCWSFAIDGFLGSSPETLVSVQQGTVTARVLAGSQARGADAAADQAAALALAISAKDLDEHQYALGSVLSALRPHSAHLTSSEIPFALKLPNLWHLASDVEGALNDGSSSLDLVDALHPTAAVAGSPVNAALATITELEPFDRGRYAGPVGWLDANGDGEWAIALRCAQVQPDGTLTAYAGCGIVAHSQPAQELAESALKFRPILEAFG